MALHTISAFIIDIKRQIERDGSQASFAAHAGISEQYLSDIINGKRAPGQKFLKAIGWERVVFYQPKKD